MKYRLTIETLSPLHIGSGEELLKDYDYVAAGGNTYVLNQHAIYAHEFDRRGGEARLLVPAGRLEIPGELSPASPFVRYTLQGAAALERLHAFIKDIHDRPYLPGSSFKGAVRTALLEHALRLGKLDLDPARLGYEARQAAQGWERGALGRNATEDLLRAVQVSDSAPLATAGGGSVQARGETGAAGQPGPGTGEGNYAAGGSQAVAETVPPVLQVTPAWVFGGTMPHGQEPVGNMPQGNVPAGSMPGGKEAGALGGQPSAFNEVEAVRQGVVFNLDLNLDELTLRYAKELGWDNRAGWLAGLVQILQAAGRARLQAELGYAQARGFSQAERFYRQLLALAERLEGASGAVLQLGWGSGWAGLTIGPRLPLTLQNEIRRKYRLGRPPNARRDWQPDLDRPYPKSRRLASASGSTPGLPFGWVLVGFAEQGRPSPLWQGLQAEFREAWQVMKARPAESPDVKPPAAPLPPPRQVLSSFTIPPAVGVWIEATVFEVTASVLRLEMDGLDPDTEAYVEVSLGGEASLRRFSEGDTLECQVVRKEKEGRVTRVVGRLG